MLAISSFGRKTQGQQEGVDFQRHKGELGTHPLFENCLPSRIHIFENIPED